MASIYQKFALVAAGTVLSVGFQNNTKVAAFTYNEAVNGDLPTIESPDVPEFEYPNVFGLDLGTNIFTGELTFSDFFRPDFDSFAFSIPTEARLESVLLSISTLPGGSGIFNTIGYGLQTSPFIYFSFLATEPITLPSTNISLFTSVLPLESGVFGIYNYFFAGGSNPGESLFQRATYTFSLTVAPVACR
jgi:hypothetical protein